MPEGSPGPDGTTDHEIDASGTGTTDRAAALRRQKETAEQLARLTAATRNLAAAIADTERIAESRAELLRTARAVAGGSLGEQRNTVVSLTEAGRRSGRHPEVLRRWCIEGRIPAVRIGRTWALSEETVALLVEHRSRARPQLGRRNGA